MIEHYYKTQMTDTAPLEMLAKFRTDAWRGRRDNATGMFYASDR